MASERMRMLIRKFELSSTQFSYFFVRRNFFRLPRSTWSSPGRARNTTDLVSASLSPPGPAQGGGREYDDFLFRLPRSARSLQGNQKTDRIFPSPPGLDWVAWGALGSLGSL